MKPIHGHSRKNGKTSLEYKSWEGMKSRCNNPNYDRYHNYGGRGIKVCERWHDFRNFYKDMGKRLPDLTLDRIDNSGDYEPGNCEWVTWEKQNNNRRPNSTGPVKQRWFFAYNEKTGKWDEDNNQREFARRWNLNNSHISACLRDKRPHHKHWTFTWFSGVN